MVFIRGPLGNLTSLVIAGENDLSHNLVFRVYVDYYRRVATVRDRVAICAFEEVLADPSIIARRLNERYGTSFNDDPMSEEEKRDVVERLEANEAQMRSRPAHGTVPNPHKQNLQPLVRSELERHRLQPAAEAAYERLADAIG